MLGITRLLPGISTQFPPENSLAILCNPMRVCLYIWFVAINSTDLRGTAMADIKKFPDSPEAMERLRGIKEAWRAEQNKSDAENGRRAWEAIEKWRQEEKERLKKDDREAIARNLCRELEDYKSNDDHGNLTDLFEHARLPLKEKSRLTLQPGKTAKDLRTVFAPYKALIEALHVKTGEELNLLANRVLLGTQFHPVSLVDHQEALLILEALQVAVDSVDLEFKLWDQCQAVAAIRKPLEEPYHKALQDGDETALSEFFEANPPHVVGSPVNLWWPLEEYLLEDVKTGEHYAPMNSFWASAYPDHGACAWAGVEIFFFPHIYLGPAIEWSGWREYRDGLPQKMSTSAKEEILANIQATPEPRVLFNKETGNYQVYQDGTEPDEEGMNGNGWDWGTDWMSNAARWLVIYPDPKAERLVPAIYTRGDTWYTELVPLSPRLIAEFDDSDRWQYVGHDAPTLLQRIKDLTGFGTGDFRVMDAWRETAERFHLNPIFRSHPGEDTQILYRCHLERWIAENRRSSDSPEDEE